MFTDTRYYMILDSYNDESSLAAMLQKDDGARTRTYRSTDCTAPLSQGIFLIPLLAATAIAGPDVAAHLSDNY